MKFLKRTITKDSLDICFLKPENQACDIVTKVKGTCLRNKSEPVSPKVKFDEN
jgi:hypothetical protein